MATTDVMQTLIGEAMQSLGRAQECLGRVLSGNLIDGARNENGTPEGWVRRARNAAQRAADDLETLSRAMED